MTNMALPYSFFTHFFAPILSLPPCSTSCNLIRLAVGKVATEFHGQEHCGKAFNRALLPPSSKISSCRDIVEFHSKYKVQNTRSRSLPPALVSFHTGGGGGGGGGAKTRDKMCKMCKPVLHSDWLLRCVVAAPESPGYFPCHHTYHGNKLFLSIIVGIPGAGICILTMRNFHL